MKKELILHIGMGKTGTTALQDFFWLNRRQLRKDGISYPRYGAVAHAHHLLSPHLPDGLDDDWKSKSVGEWAPKLNRTRQERVLLSSELIAWASEGEVADFCSSVQDWFDLKVVIYLRRQDNIIMANYNQLVKAGLQRNQLDEVLESDILLFDYLSIIGSWAKCLGKSNIVVRPYEKQQFHRGDIRLDFMHHVLGISPSSKYIFPSEDSNPRLHPLAIEYKLRLYNILLDAEAVATFNNVLLSYSRQVDSDESDTTIKQALLSPVMRNDIIARSNDTNAALAKEYLGRQDGALFLDPLPVDDGCWEQARLTLDDVRAINRHIEKVEPSLLTTLFQAVGTGLSSTNLLQSTAARFLKASEAPALFRYTTKRSPFSRVQKYHQEDYTTSGQRPQMLISLHFPAVTVGDYLPTLKENFEDLLVEDYKDRPMSSGDLIRKVNGLKGCFRYARRAYVNETAICVHGNFLPLKYRFFESTLRKRYVTWVQEPVERLQSHYRLWRSDYNLESAAELRKRMLDEDWSFEEFANCPELRNIYSMYFWGFPPTLFEFIGIAEFPELEMQRFSRDILGRSEEKMILNDAPQRYDNASCGLDPQLRKHIEHYHSEDVAFYRQALEIRNNKLA